MSLPGEEERIQRFDSLWLVSLWQVKRRKRRAPFERTFPAELGYML
jgi:hypothetical protein